MQRSQSLAAGLCLEVSRSQFLLTVAICIPLAVAIIASKLLKAAGVIFPLGLQTIDYYLLQLSSLHPGLYLVAIAGLPVLLCTAGKAASIWTAKRCLLAAVATILIVDIVLLYSGIRSSLAAIETATFVGKNALLLFNLLRWDLVFILGFLALSLLVIRQLHGSGYSRLAMVFLLCFQAPLLLLVGLETAWHLRTGEVGSSALLIYVLSQPMGLLPIVSAEIDLQSFSIVSLPLVLLAAQSWYLLRQPLAHTDNEPANVIRAGYFLWPLLVVLVLLPNLNQNANYFQFEQNLLITIGMDMSRTALTYPDGAAGRMTPGFDAPLFDTRDLQLTPTHETGRTNVILVILESASATATSIYDDARDNTPFLRTFAESSTVVEEMYVVVPRTLASWISVLQGVYPSTSTATSRWGDRIAASPDRYPGLPELLRPWGYKSAFFTPTHLDFENERQLIENMGFDHVVAKDDYAAGDFEIVNYFGYEDRVMSAPVADWVDAQLESASPFFLTLMTNVGHHDYQPPSTWTKTQYADALGRQHNDYLNSMAYVDGFLAELFSKLEEKKVLDDSLVIIVGDHGEAFGEHGKNHHMSVMYEQTLRVPAIVRLPAGSSAPGRIQGTRQLTDIFPTIVSELGFVMSGGYTVGNSLFAEFDAERPSYFGSGLDNSYLGVRHGEMKYIYYFDRRPTEVYNIATDPAELHNLGQSVDPSVLNAVERDLLSWHYTVKANLTGSPRLRRDPVLAGGKAARKVPEKRL